MEKKRKIENENKFKQKLKQEIKKLFPECVILDLNASDTQGISDMLILFQNTWAVLEVKKTAKSSKRPNQEYYVNRFNGMSFGAIIFPENKEDILNKLVKYFLHGEKL